jgi:histidinol-phosphatase
MPETVLTPGIIREYRSTIDSVLPIAREAGNIALGMQQKLLTVEIKTDGSPVSEADRTIESFIYKGISELYPDDGFEGEEETIKDSTSGRIWRVDPIDGTIQYLRGQEFWSILIGLDDMNGVGIGGIIVFPARGEIIHASKGSGCWEENSEGKKQLQVSDRDSLSDSYILHNGIEFARRANRLGRLTDLLSNVSAERGYADAFGHIEVARGRSEAMIDFLTEYHDIAAIRVAIEEAGGKWTALDGSQALNGDKAASLTTNGILHEIIRDKLAKED